MRDTAPKKKRRDAKFWVDLVSCFLIPAYTLLFAGSVEWLGIVLGSALLFAAAGMVSSALEVFFTISASLLVRQLWLRRRG